jgi:protein-tyrosine phosphatase
LPWGWLWLPIAEEGAYTVDALTLGVQFIEAALAARRKVLLHGPKGLHRTRPLVAAHLLAQGKSLARVLREIEQKPWLPPFKGNAELLRQFMQGRTGIAQQG